MTFPLVFACFFLLLWAVSLALEPLLERLLARGAHWATSFRYRDYLPVVIVAAVGLGGAMLAGDAFIDIAEQVHENAPEIDGAVHSIARDFRSAGATRFFLFMTRLGDPLSLGVLALLLAIVLILRGMPKMAGYVAVTSIVGALLNLQLKSYFARARPDLAEALRDAHGYSFPSGHAMGSTVVLGAVCYVAIRSLRSWRARAAVLAATITLITAIAASRVYLGVHWLSDIGAGMAAGLVWLSTATIAYETFRRIRMMRAIRKRAGYTASSERATRGE